MTTKLLSAFSEVALKGSRWQKVNTLTTASLSRAMIQSRRSGQIPIGLELFSRCLQSRTCRPFSKTICVTRTYATAVKQVSEKPYYVTTPIFYVNASTRCPDYLRCEANAQSGPHVGHLYSLLLADVLKRWRVLHGDNKAWFLTGTDEHGMKIQNAARKAKIDIRRFCDENHVHFKHLAEAADIKYDRFIRTTDDDHRDAVEHFWNELNHRGFIYKSKHEGWYSVSDETFFPQSAVHLIRDPRTGRKLMASMETGREVEWTSEENYHFRLSEFKDRLLDYYEKNPNFIIPKFRAEEVKGLVLNNFKDLSISRPASRLQWGIPVPDDPAQTIYVWVDALINYLTAAGYPFAPGAESKGWPPNVQVIGKDIVRFHCVYWPALLMALDLPLPRQFLSHAHWTINNAKMSKSDGNAVNPFYAIERFDVDTIRYYMIHDGGIDNDAAYDNSYIVEKYKKGLQGGLGNLTSRIMRGKQWSVPACIAMAKNDELSPLINDPDNDEHVRFRDHLLAFPDQVVQHMNEPNPRLALHAVMNMIYMSNRYMQFTSPWLLVKEPPKGSPVGGRPVEHIIYLLSEALRLSGIMLQPFIPVHAGRLLDLLGVSNEKRSGEFARYGGDYDYGTPTNGVQVWSGLRGTLFPPLASQA